MKRFCLLMILCFSCAGIFGQALNADAVAGRWYTSKRECIIEIYKKADVYYGKIVWLKEPYDEKGNPVKDDKNPDEKLRNRPLMGTTIMYGFRYSGENKWEDGKIYNPDDGNTYQAFMKLIDNNTLQLKGYIGLPLLGMNTTWTRVR